MLHAFLISSSKIQSDEYFVWHMNRGAPHFAVFFSLLLPCTQTHILSQHPVLKHTRPVFSHECERPSCSTL